MEWVYLFFGALFLFFGAEGLVQGSASFADRLGLPKVVIGLIIVGFGTSMPELVVSVGAALESKGDIAVGNVVGSNICNIGLIAGIMAIVRPITVHKRLVKGDGMVMLGTALFFSLLSSFQIISRPVGLLYLALLSLYIFISLLEGKKEGSAPGDIPKFSHKGIEIALMIAGLLALFGGGHLFVQGSIALAKKWQISEAVIGLTIVAVGTSLPELVTSIVAAYRKHSDIALGNIVGSNIFNIFGILGFASVLKPIEIVAIKPFDYLVMIGFTFVLVAMMFWNKSISRLQGFLLLTAYATYVFYLYTLN